MELSFKKTQKNKKKKNMVNIVTEVLSTVTLSPYLIRFVGVNWPLLGSLKAWLKEYGHGFKKKNI